MKSIFRTGLFLTLLFTLFGCSDDKVEESNKNSNEQKVDSIFNSSDEKPPTLIMTIGDQVIKNQMGTYNWRFIDKKTGQLVNVVADHAPPYDMVNIEESTSVNLNEPIKLNFEKEPTNFEIRVWEDKKIINTYETYEEIKEKGKYVIELLGTWEEGTGTYVFALDIQ
ncbi:hypothetical protein [Solibacillus sp. CAU 1738]|uniref:hypothetical protein n=1 Tax=Solibacillus sp. CAU 1738 TaxID=3140363 RepID=UPI0032619347